MIGMPGYATASASPLKILGSTLVTLSLITMAVQAFVWSWTDQWHPITFRLLLEPLLSVSSIGGWLSFPQESFRAHQVVTWLLGLPMGLTIFLIGGLMAIDLRRRDT